MKNFFLYVLGTAGSFYVAIIYNSKGFLLLSGAAVLLPPFFLWMLWRVERKMKCELLFFPYPDEKTGKYQVCLQIENGSPFYVSVIRSSIILKNQATGKKCKVKAEGKAKAGAAVKLTGELKQPEFGLWQAECKYICCYDWLGIFHLKKKIGEQKQIMIFPACYETNIRVGIRTKLFLSDGELYHPQIGGDDPSEVLKLRKYQKGDRLNRIHWKLSAKNDDLIIAEMSMPIGCNVVFFLDGEIGCMDKDVRTAYWEVVNTLSQGLLEQACFHYLVWYEKKEQRLYRKAIRGEEDLSDFWGEILRYQLDSCQFQKEYSREFKGDAYASEIRWTQELELFCNDKFLTKITPKQVQQQLLEMELAL